MSTKLAAYCQANNIDHSISSSDMSYQEWLSLYKKSFEEAGNEEGAEYIDIIKDDTDDLETKEAFSE